MEIHFFSGPEAGKSSKSIKRNGKPLVKQCFPVGGCVRNGQKKWKSIGKTMSDEWISNAGSVGKKIIDGFKSE